MVFTYERNVKRCEYPKDDCENYLFEDYCLKSGVAIWILALMTSGSKRGGKGKQMLRNIHSGIFPKMQW